MQIYNNKTIFKSISFKLMQEEFFSLDVTKKKHFINFGRDIMRKRFYSAFTYYNHENRTIFYIAYFGDSRVDPTGFHSKQRTEIP